jgi:hypothetical protein
VDIDELVVKLSLDPSKFTAGQKEALDSFRKTEEEFTKRLSNLEAKNKNVAYSFGDVTHAAEGLFGALAGAGMVAFAHDAINSAAASQRMATNIGIARNELDAFGKVIERNGGNADSAAASLKSYADAVQKWRTGHGDTEFLTGISQIGGADINKASPLEIVEKFAKFAETHNAQQINQTGARLGMSQEIINTVIGGLKRFQDQYQDAMKVVLSPEQNKRLADNQEAWVKLGQALEFVSKSGLSDIAPALKGFATEAEYLIRQNPALAKGTLAVSAGIIAISTSLATLSATLAVFGARTPALWVLRLLGLVSLPAAAVAVSAGAAAGITSQVMGDAKAKEWDDAHPWLKKIDAFFGLAGAGGAPTPGGGGGGSVRDAGMAYFKSQGWSDVHAAAIMANAQGESSFNPNASNDVGGGHKGLFQWGKSRRQQILAGTGIDVWNATAQKQFEAAQWELTHTEKASGEGLKKYNDPGMGAAFFDYSFERSGDSTEQQAKRGRMARNIFDQHRLSGDGGGNTMQIASVSVNITPPPGTTNPREFGRLTGQALQDYAKSIANNANSGQTKQ